MPTYPNITDARRLAVTHNLKRCVIFFTGPDGRIGYASYGKTKALCASTRRVADGMWDQWTKQGET